MNQYRCETCKKRTTVTCPIQEEVAYYKVKEYVTVPTGWEVLTSIIGCASHSDFQNQRDIVLDDFYQYLDNANKKRFALWELKQEIENLRQKAGE